MLTNPVRVTLTKKVTSNPLPIRRCLHTTPWRLNLPLSLKVSQPQFHAKKDDKVGKKKLLVSKKGKGKKRVREKDRSRFAKKVQISAFVHPWKTKKWFNYVRLVEKYALFLAKPIFSHSYTNSSKTSPKKRSWWKMRFFSLFAGRHQRVNKVTDLFWLGS